MEFSALLRFHQKSYAQNILLLLRFVNMCCTFSCFCLNLAMQTFAKRRKSGTSHPGHCRKMKGQTDNFICNESSGDTVQDEKWTKIISGMTIYKDSQLKAYLEQAGFQNIQIHKRKNWLCVTAQK